MKILIYGAGVIGSLYAVYLSRAGYSISVLARGNRLETLKNKGLLYFDKSKNIRKSDVTVISNLEANDYFDYIFLTVREEHLKPALESLADNCSPTIVTMVNSIVPYSQWEQLCGAGRILPAFPGAGGGIINDVLDAALTPRFIQPTTFGEINGTVTYRIQKLERIFHKAGIPTQIIPDMHAWQICHLAMVVPIADAYYMTDKPECVYRNRKIMKQTAKSLHDGFVQLKHLGIDISPIKMNIFRFCPTVIIAAILPLVYHSQFGNRFMYQHAIKAKNEMKELHSQLYRLLKEEKGEQHDEI